MLKSSSKYQPLIWALVALVLYVTVALAWWTTLHFRNHQAMFDDDLQILQLENPQLSSSQVQNLPEFGQLLEQYSRKDSMIYGESIVLICFLFVISFFIFYHIRRERAYEKNQQNFLLSVTHELKSPLTGIQLSLDLLRNKPDLAQAKQSKLLKNAEKDTRRLSGLIDNILLSARFESIDFKLHKERLNLSTLVEQTVNYFHDKMQFENRIDAQIQFSLFCEADATAFTFLLKNLIENALKYSPKETKVKVLLEEKKGEIHFSVQDEGVGISAEEQTKIFQKFYRVGSEMTRPTKGTGLGLYIVDRIAKFHGFSVNVESELGEGSRFSFHF